MRLAQIRNPMSTVFCQLFKGVLENITQDGVSWVIQINHIHKVWTIEKMMMLYESSVIYTARRLKSCLCHTKCSMLLPKRGSMAEMKISQAGNLSLVNIRSSSFSLVQDKALLWHRSFSPIWKTSLSGLNGISLMKVLALVIASVESNFKKHLFPKLPGL